VNGGLIVPTFRDPADDIALQILSETHPGRRIVGIDALDLVWGLGAFHCMTQQEPSA
jgi:agmatine deiminase